MQLQFLLIAVAGWMSRHQQAVIEYLQEENRILLEQLGGKPKRFTDAQRIRLARKAKLVGRRRTVRKLEPCKNGPFLGKHVSVPLLRLAPRRTGSVARFKFYLPSDFQPGMIWR